MSDEQKATETRYKLTPLQDAQLKETQAIVAQAKAVLATAEESAQRVLMLIFDAHGITDPTVNFDDATRELIVTRAPASAPPTDKLATDIGSDGVSQSAEVKAEPAPDAEPAALALVE